MFSVMPTNSLFGGNKGKAEKGIKCGEEKKIVFPSIFNGVSSTSYFLGHNKIKNILQKGQKEWPQ